MDSESADSTLCMVGACQPIKLSFSWAEVGTLYINTYLQITSSLKSILTFFGSKKTVEVYSKIDNNQLGWVITMLCKGIEYLDPSTTPT